MHHNQSSMSTSSSSSYSSVRDLSGYEFSSSQDMRGWDVYGSDNRKVGEIEDIIIDTQSQQPAFADLALKQGWFKADRIVRVPFGQLQTQGQNQAYIAMDKDALEGLPEATSDFSAIGSTSSYGSSYGTRDTLGQWNESKGAHLTLNEEQVRLEKERVQSGEAHIGKHVETETLERTVPVMHEELVVERRALSPDEAINTNARIEEGKIRVPLTAEQVSVQKRVVPTEEIVISKRQVQEERTVRADVSREKLDMDRNIPIDPQ